jgi:hypothetical protein
MSDELRECMKGKTPGPFKPLPHYNRVGDQIEWYWKDAECYAEWVQVDGVNVGAVMRSMATGEVVGVKVFGAKDMLGSPDTVAMLRHARDTGAMFGLDASLAVDPDDYPLF